MTAFSDIVIARVQTGIFHARDFTFETSASELANAAQLHCLDTFQDPDGFQFVVDIDEDGDVRVVDEENKIWVYAASDKITATVAVVRVGKVLEPDSKLLAAILLVGKLHEVRGAPRVSNRGVKLQLALPFLKGDDHAGPRALEDLVLPSFGEVANSIVADSPRRSIEARIVVDDDDGMARDFHVRSSEKQHAVQIDTDMQQRPPEGDEGYVAFAEESIREGLSRLEPVVSPFLALGGIDHPYLKSGDARG